MAIGTGAQRPGLWRLMCAALALCLAWILAMGLGVPSADAAAGVPVAYADPMLPGPPLTVSRQALESGLHCSPGLANSTGQPVLLVPGTGATGAANFSWGVEPALTAMGDPWCELTPPMNQLGDIQVGAEYDVYAIRTMYSLTHRKIAILGHSQGGLQPRWALRFWPDLRSKVDKWIGVAASNHGTTGASVLLAAFANCALACPPALFQQQASSAFVKAANEPQETFPGISYTSIYTTTDEIVVPNTGPGACSSCLSGPASQVSNIAIQDVCPGRYAEHIELIADAAMWAIAKDALTHDGPAQPSRIDRSVCSQLLMPGVTTENVLSLINIIQFANAGPVGVMSLQAAEPALACYVTATCPATSPLHIHLVRRAFRGKRRVVVTLSATTTIDGITQTVPGTIVRVGRHRARQAPVSGTVTFRLPYHGPRTIKIAARRPGYLAAFASIARR